MKKLFFLAIVAFMSMAVSAEGKANQEMNAETSVSVSGAIELKGVVSDKLTNENLAGVAVNVNGRKVYTDFDGNFTVKNVCDGVCELKISLISYEDQTVKIDTRKVKSLKVELSQR